MAKAMMSKNGSPGMVSEKLMLKLYQAEKAKVQ
jgi:hypothetical protein